MSEMMNTLGYYLEFPFVRYALIVGVLIAICSSLLGVVLVLKRYSFIGSGLSNIAFGTVTIAAAVNLTNNIFITLPVTILSAILLLRMKQNTKISGDSVIAMVSVGSLAFGYLIANMFPSSSNVAADVCTTLFGATSILTLKPVDVYVSMALAIIIVLVYLLFYHQIFSVVFDEDFANATGTKAETYNLILAIITALVIVVAMNLVGSLLISALVIFPALSSMQLFHKFKQVTIFSVVLSVVCTVFGILLSILLGTPVGSTIVVVQMIAFIICYIIRKVGGR